MPENPDDRTGTVKFKLCAYAVPAKNENANYYCCSQSDIMKSGKYLLVSVGEGDNYIEAARLGGILIGIKPLDFSFEREKIEEGVIERSCREQWICDPWNVCEDRTQTRECYDINNCGTTQLKPITQRECEEETLIDVNVKHAKALMSVLPESEKNILVILTAKELNKKIKIFARSNKEEYIKKRGLE